jgi:hypothetical protein
VTEVLAGADVVSEEPIGRQAGFPVAVLVLVVTLVLVLVLVLVLGGVTTSVVVFVVTPGEADVWMTVVGDGGALGTPVEATSMSILFLSFSAEGTSKTRLTSKPLTHITWDAATTTQRCRATRRIRWALSHSAAAR